MHKHIIKKQTVIRAQLFINYSLYSYLNQLMSSNNTEYPKVDIEYCKVCDYKGHCMDLAGRIKESNPNAKVLCKHGRQGAFEIVINDKLVYSKLQTMALPDYKEVIEVVRETSNGAEPRKIIAEQPVNCAIS